MKSTLTEDIITKIEELFKRAQKVASATETHQVVHIPGTNITYVICPATRDERIALDIKAVLNELYHESMELSELAHLTTDILKNISSEKSQEAICKEVEQYMSGLTTVNLTTYEISSNITTQEQELYRRVSHSKEHKEHIDQYLESVLDEKNIQEYSPKFQSGFKFLIPTDCTSNRLNPKSNILFASIAAFLAGAPFAGNSKDQQLLLTASSKERN